MRYKNIKEKNNVRNANTILSASKHYSKLLVVGQFESAELQPSLDLLTQQAV